MVPEDVQAVLPAVVGHRLTLRDDLNAAAEVIANGLIELVKLP